MSPLKYSIRYCVFLRDILIDAKVNYFTMIIVVMYWWQKKKKKEKKQYVLLTFLICETYASCWNIYSGKK